MATQRCLLCNKPINLQHSPQFRQSIQAKDGSTHSQSGSSWTGRMSRESWIDILPERPVIKLTHWSVSCALSCEFDLKHFSRPCFCQGGASLPCSGSWTVQCRPGGPGLGVNLNCGAITFSPHHGLVASGLANLQIGY